MSVEQLIIISLINYFNNDQNNQYKNIERRVEYIMLSLVLSESMFIRVPQRMNQEEQRYKSLDTTRVK